MVPIQGASADFAPVGSTMGAKLGTISVVWQLQLFCVCVA